MDLLLAALCGFLAVALMAAVLLPTFDDGIIGKTGLIMASLGFGAAALQMLEGGALARPLLLVGGGIVLALFAPAVRPALRRLAGRTSKVVGDGPL